MTNRCHIHTPQMYDGSPDKPIPQTETWCGAPGSASTWCFVGLDHAAQNARNGGTLLPYMACVAAAAEVMNEQHNAT